MELLERDAALDTLEAALLDAAVGRGRIALISGEAGIGKTSLVRTFVASRASGARILWTTCDDLVTPRALGPVHDLASALGDDLQTALRAGDHDLVFDLVLEELGGSPTPVVLVVEDVHWADEATLDLLALLSQRIERARVLAILTYRRDDVAADHPLRRVVARIPREVEVRTALEPLSAEAVATIVGDQGDPDEVLRTTGGNPFLVTELVTAHAEGSDEPDRLVVPETVQDAVLARVSRLDAAGRELVQLVSVVPSRMEGWLLDRVRPGWEADADQPEQRGILRLDHDGLSFRHELARLAVLEAIPAPRRRALHRDVLGVLVEQDADPARIVHHAEAGGDHDALATSALEAARRAAAASSHREALAHYRRAVSYLDRLDPLAAAEALEEYGKECETRELLDEGVDAYERALRARTDLGQEIDQGRLWHLLSGMYQAQRRPADARRAMAESVRILEGAGDEDALARAYAHAASRAMTHWELEEFDRLVALARPPARRRDNRHVLALCDLVEGSLAFVRDDPARGRELLRASQRVYEELDDHYALMVALANLADGELLRHDLDRLAVVLDEALAHGDAHEIRSVHTYVRGIASRGALLRGDWRTAEELARGILDSTGEGINRSHAILALARLQVRRGDDDASATVDEAIAITQRGGEIERIAPALCIRAEHDWLHDRLTTEPADLLTAWEEVAVVGEPWTLGELTLWRHRAGAAVSTDGLAEPYRLQVAGDHGGAARTWQALSHPYEQAEALIGVGDEPSLREALAILDLLGGGPLAERARDGLRALGAENIPRGPQPTTRENPAGLTTRQVEVLELVSEGLTNAEIADRLVVSVRTVDNHVSAILTKLGVASRQEAAAVASDLGIATTRSGS